MRSRSHINPKRSESPTPRADPTVTRGIQRQGPSIRSRQMAKHREANREPVVRVAVIGGGPGGAEFAKSLIGATTARDPQARFEIRIYEPGEDIAAGVAWGPASRRMSTNMAINRMELDEGQGGQIGRELGYGPLTQETSVFAPREDVGLFLGQRWRAARLSAAHAGVDIVHVPECVSSISSGGSRWELRLDSSAREQADLVVLAIGNLPATQYPHLAGKPGFHGDPWRTGKLCHELIAPDAAVLILGAGPTGIDVAKELMARGQRGMICMGSVTGRLPWVRPRHGEVPTPLWLTADRIAGLVAREPRKLSLRELHMALDREASAGGVGLADVRKVLTIAAEPPSVSLAAGIRHAGAEQPYFTYLKRLDAIAPELWNELDDAAREVVWRHRATYMRVSFAQPPTTAQRLLRGLQDGALQVRGGIVSVKPVAGARFGVTWADGDLTIHDAVVEATGLGGPLDKLESPLVAQMRADRMLSPHLYGGAKVSFHSGQVLGPDERPSRGLYSLAGSLTQGTHFIVNSLTKVAESAARTAEAVADDIMALSPGRSRLR